MHLTISNFIQNNWGVLLWGAETVITIITCIILYIMNKIDSGTAIAISVAAGTVVFGIGALLAFILMKIGKILQNARSNYRIKQWNTQNENSRKELLEKEKEAQLERDYQDVVNMIYTP
jgi:hypothetical protein